jgi:hypothetical protein
MCKISPPKKMIWHFIFSAVTFATSKRTLSGLDFNAFTNPQKMSMCLKFNFGTISSEINNATMKYIKNHALLKKESRQFEVT